MARDIPTGISPKIIGYDSYRSEENRNPDGQNVKQKSLPLAFRREKKTEKRQEIRKMPAEKQDRNAVFTEEEEDDDSLDEDEDHSTLQQSQLNDDEDEELEEEEDLNSPSHSFSDDYEDDENPKNPNSNPSLRYKSVGSVPVPPPSNGSVVPLPKPPPPPPPVKTEPLSPKRERATADDEKKPSAAMDDSRRLFQRLWTDEDEIGLLQGFLDYSSHRSQTNSFASHHDTSQFYDQVKDRLQLDFNKSQLVEKLRRLKKKYRNVLSRIGSGKDFSFKSPHDQATFEISRKIWSTPSAGTFDDDDGNQQNGNLKVLNNSDRKVPIPTPRKRSRKTPATATEANVSTPPPLSPTKTSSANPNPSPNVIEDTVRSCLSPLFKELLYCAVNGQSNSGITGGMSLNPLPLNFGGNSANLGSSEGMSEKWRRQQILELEVYSKRLELVQEQINSALENLKSMGGQ